jgi:alpha,alpha-trehalase
MRNSLLLITIMIMLASCKDQEKKLPVDFYATDLFKAVQLQSIFPDSKTFVDCTPKKPIEEVLEEYERVKTNPDFNLRNFVEEHFYLPQRPVSAFKSDSLTGMEEHISLLWPVLTRHADAHTAHASLIALPHQYVVPGGRFSEVYYWDSYFTMLGLKAQGRFDLIEDMVKNFAFLIDSLGFIPNGNRNYYLTRSQPPFFSLMVKLLESKDPQASAIYLEAMKKEYAFWMHGLDSLKNPGDVSEHVVMMADGSVLNRYFDKGSQPRPEAFKEDVKLAQEAGSNPEIGRNPEHVYKALRSAAESGWDFSSRWMTDGKTLSTIETTDVVPVDLNALLWHLEKMIAAGYILKNDKDSASLYTKKYNERRRALQTFCWDPDAGFYFDYLIKDNRRSSSKSLAGVYPLFFGIAQPDQAKAVSVVLSKEFLQPGGLTTTLQVTGQQWDAPNGWAPLQWICYKGLKNYQITELADEIKRRWLRQNLRVYHATGKMMEKYNVMDTSLVAGGGEYPNQDGFGWTNGVALAMMKDQ